MRRTVNWSRPAALLVAMAALAGCGSDESDLSPEETLALIEKAPSCADVWRAGEILPTDYQGCRTADAFHAAPHNNCGLNVYKADQEYFALRGEPIVAVPDATADPQFQELVSACVAD